MKSDVEENVKHQMIFQLANVHWCRGHHTPFEVNQGLVYPLKGNQF